MGGRAYGAEMVAAPGVAPAAAPPPMVGTGELVDWAAPARQDGLGAAAGRPLVLVDLDRDAAALDGWRPGALPVVVAGVTAGPAPDPPPAEHPCDIVLGRDDPLLAQLVAAVGRHPLAAVAAAVLLRDTLARDVEHGLAAESAVYSLLQAGPEFRAWRAARRPVVAEPDDEPVRLERDGDTLTVTLNRPHRHNAVDQGLRDGLTAALTLAATDASIARVELRGAGPSFCSGGDLDTFGSFPDPATAHASRLTRSPGRLAHLLGDRLHVFLHGACMGAGIEVPAFAGHVVAAADTVLALPELGAGLVPGAGGTVSLPRRIGRHRTALLALTGARIDAPTARSWGLVDELA